MTHHSDTPRTAGETGCWLLIANKQHFQGQDLTGREVIERRARDRFFGVGPTARNLTRISAGDRVVLYAAGTMEFVGQARVRAVRTDGQDASMDHLSTRPDSVRGFSGVFLDEVEMWTPTVPMQEVREQMPLLRGRQNPGAVLQATVKPLTEADVDAVVAAARAGA